jgi:DNA adenine methylase
MSLIGNKNNKNLYNNLLKKLIPDNLILYIEPFGGEFGLYEIMENKPNFAIYNDININVYNNILNKYNNVIYYNKDYKEIFLEFDDYNSFFYIDPPYYKKEHKYENHNFLEEKNHIELSHILKNLKGKFLLSYQDNPFIRKLYNGYNFYKYLGNNRILKPEIAITNYV